MTRRARRGRRVQARAAAADSRRQSLLLSVVITILGCIAVLLWSHQLRAAVSEQARASATIIQAKETPATQRDVLVGRWYGEQSRAGGKMKRWVVDAYPDGVFRITFRFYEPEGGYREQVEVGEWAISGPVYFLSTKGWIQGDTFLKADSASPELYDAYRIISLEPKLFEYEHFVSGSRYKVRRVNAGFALPE